MRKYLFLALSSASFVIGCASPAVSPGIVMVGPDTYMLQPQSNPGNLSANGMKSVMLKQAEEFCQADGRRMQQIVSMARENAVGIYAATEVQFRCMAPRDRDDLTDVKKGTGKLEIR